MPGSPDRAEILKNARAAFLAAFPKSGVRIPAETLDPLITENLICPWSVRVPRASLERIRAFVKAAFALRMNPAYREWLRPEMDARRLVPQGNHSLFMSYDFHLRGDGTPALIEVNTNASFFGLSFPLYAAKNIPHLSREETLRADVLREVQARAGSAREPLKVVITDEKPSEQRLFSEFLFYQKLFESWGWSCDIRDVRELEPGADLVYNRHTDFYLESETAAKLRAFYLDGRTCVSPNPNEYCLLADKQRMIDWNTPGNLDLWKVSAADQAVIRAVLPAARDLTPANAEEVWKDRKQLFFKPKRSFGAKQSYKGASISRKAFDEIVHQETIAQEYVQAPEITFPEVADLGAFKYDLRVYADRDEVRGIVARVFQGQVTNTRTPFGGFSAVVFE